MDYILGAGLVFASVQTIAFGRIILNRAAAPVDNDTFGAAEGIAFLFTVTLTVGIAMMARKAFADASLFSLAQMGAALTAVAVVSVAAWAGMARLVARAPTGAALAPPGPVTPGRGRPQQPSGAGAEGGRQTRGRRAA